MNSHAILSPSAASRWLACTPSARLEMQFPDKVSEYAEEGTLAHTLGELMIKLKRKAISKTAYKNELKAIKENSFYSAEMLDLMEQYSDFVIEQYNDAKSKDKTAIIVQEMKLDLTDYIPECFGTVDNAIISDEELVVIDLKYGKGVPVDAFENKQMMIYALGTLSAFAFLYDIKVVKLIIYQPRLQNYPAYAIEVPFLEYWAEEVLKNNALLAFNGEGNFKVGDHCRFCKARPVCKAHAEEQLKIAQYEFRAAELLNEIEVADVLTRISSLVSWAGEIKDYALNEAVKGKEWPGFKLVAGRSNRTYTSESDILKALFNAEIERDTYIASKLKGVTELEKELGPELFAQILNPFIIKPPGAPTLVPLSDKRPVLDRNECAKADFA